jgi:hypothetical protein
VASAGVRGEGLMEALAGALHVSPTLHDKVAALRRAMADGTLVVVTDFDHTLTMPVSQECHDIVGNAAGMPEPFRAAMAELLDFSQPVPAHGCTTPDAWWGRCNDLMVEHGLTKGVIREMVAAAPCFPRAGLDELLGACATRTVPLLVVSAGLSDVIEEFLKQRCPAYSSIIEQQEGGQGGIEEETMPALLLRVSANRMVFSEEPSGGDHQLVAFEAPSPWHSHNKHETAEREKAFLLSSTQWRRQSHNDDSGDNTDATATTAAVTAGIEQVLVLGDKPYDVDAASGIVDGSLLVDSDGSCGAAVEPRCPVPPHQLRIGFFDAGGTRYSLEEYKDAFDVVLPSSDSGLEIAIALLNDEQSDEQQGGAL